MKDILTTEYSYKFDQLRKNRILVSYHKYGPIKHNYGEKLVNGIETLKRCLKKYEETGNTEYMIDVANYAMFEFMYPQHKDGHFTATDSKESAGVVGMTYNEIKEASNEY